MSLFVQQNGTLTDYSPASHETGSSWSILSPIELSIKRKIEAVGKPLKDWDITINYGIKTGCNEAFIIDGAKREEILNNCKTTAERERTDALIRPILRGRDIKRYKAEWAGLYVILAKFGSHHYLEKDYPAIFNHLLQYEDKLKSRGQVRYTSSKKVREGAEYPGQHHWLELDNNPCDKYLEDFLKQKIIYPNMTKFLPFYLDNTSHFYHNDKSFMITGTHISFLTAFLNSSLFKFCFLNSFPELLGETRELRKVFFDKIPVIEVSNTIEQVFSNLVNDIQQAYSKQKAIHIDQVIFDLYGLTEDERVAVGFIEL